MNATNVIHRPPPPREYFCRGCNGSIVSAGIPALWHSVRLHLEDRGMRWITMGCSLYCLSLCVENLEDAAAWTPTKPQAATGRRIHCGTCRDFVVAEDPPANWLTLFDHDSTGHRRFCGSFDSASCLSEYVNETLARLVAAA